MKRQRHDVSGIVCALSPVEAGWQDQHASDCIQFLRQIPDQESFTAADIEKMLRNDFKTAKTVFQLFLDVSKDQMTLSLKQALGDGGIGITRFKEDPAGYIQALESLGLSSKMHRMVTRPLHWSDVLIERLKGGRGSAIKGQQRGRGLEDFTENILLRVFSRSHVVPRCRFVGASGESTEKADFAVPSLEDPQLLIEAKAYGATGSKQTDILGDLHRIIEEKRDDTVLMLVTDGMTWKERLSDLAKLVDLQNHGRIFRIYTQAMAEDLFKDLQQFKIEAGL
jgi:hypothetical protein